MPKAREGAEHERGDYSPSGKGGFGGLLEEFFEFWALLCAFKWVFYVFGTGFSCFGHIFC